MFGFKKIKRRKVLRGAIIVFIITMQCWAFVAHQRMINSNLNKINRYESMIEVLMYNESNDLELIANYFELVNDTKLINMPIERRLGYIEISFLIYPVLGAQLTSVILTSKYEKKDYKNDKS